MPQAQYDADLTSIPMQDLARLSRQADEWLTKTDEEKQREEAAAKAAAQAAAILR